MKTLKELIPELQVLAKRGNFPRLTALLKIHGHKFVDGVRMSELTTGREVIFLLGKVKADIELQELNELIDDCERVADKADEAIKSGWTKTKLNKMKKAELVDLILSL